MLNVPHKCGIWSQSELRLFANAPTYKRWLNINIRCAAKMAAFPVSGACGHPAKGGRFQLGLL